MNYPIANNGYKDRICVNNLFNNVDSPKSVFFRTGCM